MAPLLVPDLDEMNVAPGDLRQLSGLSRRTNPFAGLPLGPEGGGGRVLD
jgi:hypothetical protein